MCCREPACRQPRECRDIQSQLVPCLPHRKRVCFTYWSPTMHQCHERGCRCHMTTERQRRRNTRTLRLALLTRLSVVDLTCCHHSAMMRMTATTTVTVWSHHETLPLRAVLPRAVHRACSLATRMKLAALKTTVSSSLQPRDSVSISVFQIVYRCM